VSDETGDTGDGALSAALHAGRTAAAAAALGAAVGAARAFTSRTGADADEQEAEREAEPVADGVEEEPEADRAAAQGEPEREPEREPVRGVSADRVRNVAERARQLLRELQGSDAESVSGLERAGEGWRVLLEVVEVARVPESTDVLATYAVELDGEGELVGFERVRRYYRAQADLGEDRA
jgi:gas vesicle protein GvpO